MLHIKFWRITLPLIGIAVVGSSGAQVMDPNFSGRYGVTNIGHVPGVPDYYGSLIFPPGQPNKIWIGGSANTAIGALYEANVVRGAGGHIVGFNGIARRVFEVPYIDGGLTFTPDGQLLMAVGWPSNHLYQYKAGSSVPSKDIDLAPFGIVHASSSLFFIPPGAGNEAGQLRIGSWPSGDMYRVMISPDGTGTYNVTGVEHINQYIGGPEQFCYAPAATDPHAGGGVLVAEYTTSTVAAYYELDAHGDANPASRLTVLSGIYSSLGVTVDPVTGDYLLTTFGAQANVLRMVPSHTLIAGHVNLQDYSISPEGQFFFFEVRPNGGGAVLENSFVYLDTNGDYNTYTSLPAGQYQVSIKPWNWLRQTKTITITPNTTNSASFDLLNGDADDDNEITLSDYAQILYSMGTVPGDANWFNYADLNWDGEVNLADYSIMSRNFGQTGDE